jgi:hypothetical protein
LILSPHPVGRQILDEAHDQPLPGSFPKEDPGYEVVKMNGYLAYLIHYYIKLSNRIINTNPRNGNHTLVLPPEKIERILKEELYTFIQ